MVEVKIQGQAITHQYGTLNTGDILRTSEEFAAHLVNDCKVAEYVIAAPEVEQKATPEAEQEVEQKAKPVKK
jgi:hypothetical protein